MKKQKKSTVQAKAISARNTKRNVRFSLKAKKHRKKLHEAVVLSKHVVGRTNVPEQVVGMKVRGSEGDSDEA